MDQDTQTQNVLLDELSLLMRRYERITRTTLQQTDEEWRRTSKQRYASYGEVEPRMHEIVKEVARLREEDHVVCLYLRLMSALLDELGEELGEL